VLIHAGHITSPWGPEHLSGLRQEDLQVVLDAAPEVLLIGTGRTTSFPAADILSTLAARHIGVECMDSRAAARTYNVLVAEGRRVSAAILLPDA